MKTVLAFDVYGTLIDTAGVVARLRDLVGDRAEAFSDMWRLKQLEYSFRRALMHRYEEFSVCVAESLDYVCASFDARLTSESRARLLDTFRRLPPFDDAEDCLTGLHAGEFELYALSNGSLAAVETLLEESGIRGRFLDIVSVDEVRTFKPDAAVYRHFLDRAGVDGSRAWLVSGNPFDVIGAMSAGMRGMWVKRSPGAVYNPWGIEPTVTVGNLAEIRRRLEAWNSQNR